MKAEQVDQALRLKFVDEGERLVFWHDPNGEFQEYVDAGLPDELDAVQVLNLNATGGLSAKMLLEREDANGKYLIYTSGETTPADEDWLLDVRLYSAQFSADVASMWRQELGLASLSMREYLESRAAFLRSQERRRRLEHLVAPDDDAAAVDLKMMAVLAGVKTPQPDLFDVLRGVCQAHESNGVFDLSVTPGVIETFEKMSLAEEFWRRVEREFGYGAESRTLAGLLRGIFVSDLLRQGADLTIEALTHYRLPNEGQRNSVVFLSSWRDSATTAVSYDAVATAVEKEQHVSEALAPYGLEQMRDVYTFWAAEQRVIKALRDLVLADRDAVDVDLVSAVAAERIAEHWLSGPGSDTGERRAIAAAYEAIVAAAELFILQSGYRQGFSFETPEALLSEYRDSLSRFDRLYRQFCSQATPAQEQGWDLLKALSDEVEAAYGQGFLQPLGFEWSRLLDAGFLEQWELASWTSQQHFFDRHIRRHLGKADTKRAFVIISDGFRYEAAQELGERLNAEYGMGADLSAMLGVLPSYTALGMASLLPHETISYSDKGDVLVDGQSTAGTKARGKQLETVAGMAIRAEDLLEMTSDQAREATRDKRVVYIYHDEIDSRGEGSTTERSTFDAVARCIDTVGSLVQLCVSRLGAGKVWVTADHGFLFQSTFPSETSRSKVDNRPNVLASSPRFAIGRELGKVPEVHCGSLQSTVGAEGGMDFWVPRGANRFHFGGGARYVHGGAMPQEVVVPLLTVTRLRGAQREGSRSEKVSVQVLGANHKITTPRYRFEIIQTEAVSERRKPLTVRAAVYEGAELVTSVETVSFDSDSDSLEERKKSILLELRTGTYDKATPYRLVLRDAETEAEVQSVPVVIDRSFDDDF